MKIKDAIQRFVWRFGKGTFTPNQNDVEALNEVINYYNATEKQQYEANELFAKLYITMYGVYLKHYKSTVFDTRARGQMHKILDKPLIQIIEDFKDVLNNSEFYYLMNDSGIDLRGQTLKLSEQKEKEVQTIQEKIKDPENALKFTGDVWDIETVTENVIAEVNNAINLYRK